MSVVRAVLSAAILVLRVETSRAALEDIKPETGDAQKLGSNAVVSCGTGGR